ncbi:MAG: hypothetical protein M1812_003552 [Candelaria pacifica]|nr:MAG: hypothetical protein M1812_003552 [Candelaria pacifica]
MTHHFTFAARFDRFDMPAGLLPTMETPVIMLGPPNPPPELSPIFGSPDWKTCFYVSGLLLPGQRGEDRILSPELTAITEFLGPGSISSTPSNSLQPMPKFPLPKHYSSTSLPAILSQKDCQIALLTLSPPGPSNSDNATFRDVFLRSREIAETGMTSRTTPQNGGHQIFGENNNLVIFLYASDSEYEDAFDFKAGCIRRGRDKIFNLLNRLGFFTRTCSPTEETASSSSSSSSSSNDGFNPGTDPADTNVDEIAAIKMGCMDLKPLQVVDVLYGLKTITGILNEWIIRSCGNTILEIIKGA